MPVALTETQPSYDEDYRPVFEQVHQYLEETYTEVGEVAFGGPQPLRVLVRADLAPMRRLIALLHPCGSAATGGAVGISPPSSVGGDRRQHADRGGHSPARRDRQTTCARGRRQALDGRGVMKPSVRTATHRLFAAGLFGLGIAAAAYGTLHVTFGPRPVSIHVRWAPGVEDTVRQEAEQRYHLSEGELLEGRT